MRNSAAIDGRDDSSDADAAEIWIDVDLDEVRCKCTGVRASAR